MRCPRQLVLGVTLAVVSASAHAASNDLPLDLDWQAPSECYSADMIRDELGRIARVSPGRAPAKLSVHGRIERVGEEYRLALTLERNGDVGERHLAASECRALGREVTLVLALAFGEGVELVPEESSTPQPKPAPAPQAPPEQHPKPEPAVAQAAADTEDLRVALFLGGGVLLGALPAVAAHAFAGAEVGWRRVWLAPRLDVLPRVDDTLGRGVDARYDGLGGGLALCFGEPALTALLAVCATGGAMAVRGRAWGATESGSAVAPWYTAGAGVSAAWPEQGVISVRLAATLLVSLNQPRFVVDGLGEAHEIPRLVPGFAASVLFRL